MSTDEAIAKMLPKGKLTLEINSETECVEAKLTLPDGTVYGSSCSIGGCMTVEQGVKLLCRNGAVGTERLKLAVS